MNYHLVFHARILAFFSLVVVNGYNNDVQTCDEFCSNKMFQLVLVDIVFVLVCCHFKAKDLLVQFATHRENTHTKIDNKLYLSGKSGKKIFRLNRRITQLYCDKQLHQP